MNKLHTHWNFIWTEINRLATQIEDSGREPEMVVGIARGGIIPGAMLARQLNLPFMSIDPDECLAQWGNICIVVMDDIFDFGDTMNKLFENGVGDKHIYCCLYNKNIAIDELHTLKKPDFAIDLFTDKWIVFPWESEDE
jgi:hypothetical protein